MVGFAVATITNSFIAGFLAAALVGALVALLIAFMSIGLKQSQVAVGYVLAIATKSLAYFLGAPLCRSTGKINTPGDHSRAFEYPIYWANSVQTNSINLLQLYHDLRLLYLDL